MAQRSEQCTPGYSIYNGKCVQCSGGMTSDGGDGACYCDAGTYTFMGNMCSTCSRHQFSARNATKCVECASDEVSGPLQRSCMKGSACDEASGFVLGQNSCVCPPKTFLSLDASACVSQCGDNQTFASIVDEFQIQSYCLCSNGFVPAPGNRNCISLSDCSDDNNMKLNNFTCSCKDDSVQHFDPITNMTTCQTQVSCQKSQFYDKKSNSCKPCQTNAESTGGQAETCSCLPGFVDVSGSCVVEVPSCQENQYISNNSCVNCPENSTSPGGASQSCKCTVNGAQWINGTCEVKQAGIEQNKGKEQNNLAFIAIPIVLIFIAAILAAIIVPLVRHKRQNRLRVVNRDELV